jgi:hypothetical protein
MLMSSNFHSHCFMKSPCDKLKPSQYRSAFSNPPCVLEIGHVSQRGLLPMI